MSGKTVVIAAAYAAMVVGVLPSGSGAAGRATATAAKTAHCRSFTYKHRHAGVTYRFYHLRIRGAKCRTIKRVVYGYFHDRGEPAGSSPTAGYNVYGWNVVIVSGVVDGRRGKAYFRGKYR
jgi:hypothetical protein